MYLCVLRKNEWTYGIIMSYGGIGGWVYGVRICFLGMGGCLKVGCVADKWMDIAKNG